MKCFASGSKRPGGSLRVGYELVEIPSRAEGILAWDRSHFCPSVRVPSACHEPQRAVPSVDPHSHSLGKAHAEHLANLPAGLVNVLFTGFAGEFRMGIAAVEWLVDWLELESLTVYAVNGRWKIC